MHCDRIDRAAPMRRHDLRRLGRRVRVIVRHEVGDARVDLVADTGPDGDGGPGDGPEVALQPGLAGLMDGSVSTFFDPLDCDSLASVDDLNLFAELAAAFAFATSRSRASALLSAF